MNAYHFHCSGPAGIVLDVLGSRVEGEAEQIAGAARAAREVLALYPEAQLADWFVTVQDGAGRQVAVLGFGEVLHTAESLPTAKAGTAGRAAARVERTAR
jgi:hypothetical protein